MTDFGYHASHEQFTPRELVAHVERAERQGFTDVLTSDDVHPWSQRRGESGHAWSWLGAAMASTDLTFGTVNAPGYRSHPAVVAQAAATLRHLYPGRFWLAVDTGEFADEHGTGERGLPEDGRDERLRESVGVMRQLWAGETVSHVGRVTVEEATLSALPDSPPPVVGVARSASTARWLAEWADGMVTVAGTDHEGLRRRVEAFRDVAPDKPVFLTVRLSYAADEETALEGAFEGWRANRVPGDGIENPRTTGESDDGGERIGRDQLRERVRVSADPADHVEWLRRDVNIGFEKVFLHNVNAEQQRFIQDFGEQVLPELE